MQRNILLHWSLHEFPSDNNPCEKKRCNEMNSSNNDRTQPTLDAFGESEDWIGKYGHKGTFHRHMSNLNIPAIMEDVSQSSHQILNFRDI